MEWKKFLKPDKTKIILFVVFVMLGLTADLFCTPRTSCNIPFICISLPTSVCMNSNMYLILFPIVLIIVYLIACLFGLSMKKS